ASWTKKPASFRRRSLRPGGASSVLALRHVEADAVQVVARDELTGQAGVLRGLFTEVEHGFFHGLDASKLALPFSRHEYHAGGAGAGAAAITVDAGNALFHSRFHQRHTVLHLDRVFGAVMFDIGNLRH